MSCIPKILELKGDKDHLHTMDHSKLPADCGNVIEGGGEYKGYHYLITFTGTAHRCGYVGIEEGHPLYGKDLMQNSAPDYFQTSHIVMMSGLVSMQRTLGMEKTGKNTLNISVKRK